MSTYQMGRGESRTFTVTVTNLASQLVDLTNAKIVVVVYDLAGNVVFEKRSAAAGGSDNEIEIPDQAANGAALKGKYYLKVSELDSDLEPNARWADSWVVTAGGTPEYLKVDEHAPFYVTGSAPPAFA